MEGKIFLMAHHPHRFHINMDLVIVNRILEFVLIFVEVLVSAFINYRTEIGNGLTI
jgi:hypothetical protein